jgi:hypothetical protein
VHQRVDERETGERQREVAEVAAGVGVDLLGPVAQDESVFGELVRDPVHGVDDPLAVRRPAD